MVILETKKISKHFGGIQAVSNVDLEINEGEILGLIGPNGSGKTTLLNLVNGILKPTSGKVILQGQEITGLAPHVLAEKGVGRTFQQNMLFKRFTVWENVLLAHETGNRCNPWGSFFKLSGSRAKEKEAQQLTLRILEGMKLLEWKDKLCNDIPHGIQRMVGVAISAAVRPKVMILDEPFSGMNLSEIANMLYQIKMLRQNGTTILIVEHQMKVVMNLCDRIGVLNFGRKIAEGSPEEIRNNQEVIKAYLGEIDNGF